jgi:hypothetical protein
LKQSGKSKNKPKFGVPNSIDEAKSSISAVKSSIVSVQSRKVGAKSPIDGVKSFNVGAKSLNVEAKSSIVAVKNPNDRAFCGFAQKLRKFNCRWLYKLPLA